MGARDRYNSAATWLANQITIGAFLVGIVGAAIAVVTAHMSVLSKFAPFSYVIAALVGGFLAVGCLWLTWAFVRWVRHGTLGMPNARNEVVESQAPIQPAPDVPFQRIDIIAPENDDILTGGRVESYGGRTYPVRVRFTGELEKGQSIWILNENPYKQKFWPQCRCAHLRRDEWEATTYLSEKQDKVTILALIASPAVDALFEYYLQAMAPGHVVAISGLPPECKVMARSRVRSPENA